MTLSHWATTITQEKLSATMRWVATSAEDTDSLMPVTRLIEADVVPTLVANLLLFELQGSEPDIEELHLSLDSLSRHLRSAYERAYSYLLTPEAFLADFLASIEGVTLDDTLSKKLKIFTEYDYFAPLLAEWAKEKRANEISFVPRTDLVVKLREIDTLILRHATISVMVDILDPLYAFHRHRSPDPVIPGSELALFFDDKGVAQAVSEFESRSSEQLKFKDAVQVISFLLGTEFTAPEVSIPETPLEEPEYPETHYDAFLQDLHEAGVDLRTPDETAKLLPSIELFIGSKLRERTIQNVFHGNKREYERFIKFLDASSNINKALLNLETALKLQRVGAESKVARRLHEAVTMRFHQYTS